jgi:sperm-associated antigen 16 protein
MVAEVTTLRAGRHPANRVAFDGSGALLAVASDDGRVRVFDSARGDLVTELAGHEDAVQAAVFDRDGGFLVSCGSDNAFKLWAA